MKGHIALVLVFLITITLCGTLTYANSDLDIPLTQDPLTPELILIDSDSVWLDEGGSVVQLVHTARVKCNNPDDCPKCWVVTYTPHLDIDIPTSQIPSYVGIILHDFLDQPVSYYERPSQARNHIITTDPLVMPPSPESGYSLAIQAVVNFPSNYNQTLSYDATLDFSSTTNCAVQASAHQVAVPWGVDSPTTTLRKEVSTYFFNTYVPGAPYFDPSSASPKGMDPRRNHAELQTSAWFNWEMIPASTETDADYPNLIDLRVYGTSYFVINDTYSQGSSMTLCWINSLPVLVEIDTRTNQTIYINTQPRLDMHNPLSALSQPIPLEISRMNAFRNRFFFEFTCQDRLKIVYNPTTVRRDLLVYAIGYKDESTGIVTYRQDRYPQSLSTLETYVHGSTPNEVLGRAFYDRSHNIFICRTTIDFHEVTWLDDTKNNLNIVIGIDGVTYGIDQAGESPQSSALLSILPDVDVYPDINPHFTQSQLNSMLFISDVSSTGVGGPYITFRLPSMRPYPDSLEQTPSSRCQVNIIFQVRDPVFHVKEPSCSIIMDNLRSGDATLSYSTSQYMNATATFDSAENQKILQDKLAKMVMEEQQEQSETSSSNTNSDPHHPTPPKLPSIMSQIKSLSQFPSTNNLRQIYPLPQPQQQTNHSQSQQFDNSSFDLDAVLAIFGNAINSLDHWLQNQLRPYFPPQFISVPSDTPYQQARELLTNNNNISNNLPFTPQGFNYLPTTDPQTGITIISQPFKTYKLRIENPNRIDFDFISVNALPGLSRIAFNSGVQNTIYPSGDSSRGDDEFQLDPQAQGGDGGIFETLKTDNRPELSTNGEQYIIPCHYTRNKNLKLQGALSIFARDLHIGPINHDFVQRQTTVEIECEGVEIVPEFAASLSDYDYKTETILDPHYPLDKTFSELKIAQYQHFVTLYTIVDNSSSTPQAQNNDNNVSKIATIETQSLAYGTTANPSDLEESMSTLQQPIDYQIYLNRLASFSIQSPQKTYKRLIIGIVVSAILALALIFAYLPFRRWRESKRDQKRHNSVKIEVGMNTIPFEELDDEN